MDDKLNALLIDSTDKHPMVIELKKKIAAAREEMEVGNYNVGATAIASSDGELKDLKEELKTLKEELTTSSLDASKGGENRAKLATATNEKLYKLLLLEKVEKAVAEDVNVNQKLYNELLERLETAKITQRLEASKEGTRYIILDPARLPLTPAKPNKVLVLLMGMFIGACLGTGLVFGAEMFDHSLLSTEDAKAHLDLPLIGATSKIITEADVHIQKLRNIKITSASVLTGAILLVVIIFNIILGS